jgi:hypothetical protein
LIRLVLLKAIAAEAASTLAVAADAPSVLAKESNTLLASLLGQSLDVLVPSQHGLVAFGAEYPAVSLVHTTRLTTLEHELGARRTDVRVRAELLVSEVERHHRRLGVDLVCRLELVQVSWWQDIPAWAVRLEVLALALEHASADLGGGWVISARVGDVLNATQRHVWRNEVRVSADKRRPLLVLGHGNRAAAKCLNCLVSVVALALEDSSKSVVSFLDFADNNWLELTTRGFKVEVGLVTLVIVPHFAQDIFNFGLTLWR